MKEISQKLIKQTLYLTILIKIGQQNQDVNLSEESFLDNMNLILDELASLKQIMLTFFISKWFIIH